MMSFSRWKSASDASWPYRRFRAHHAQLNAFYWTYWASDHLSRRHAKSAIADTETAAHFALLGDDSRRPPRTVGELTTTQRECSNWIRLNAAMAMSSYLELYLRQVATLALWSDPSLILKRPRVIDGLAILKHGPQLDAIGSMVQGITQGDWAARLARYGQLFGSVPAALEANRTELHNLQTLRNRVGHEFGRNSNNSDLSWVSATVSPSERLSEERLKKWLAIVEIVGRAIDRHLLSAHIGSFEVLLLHHRSRDPQGRRLSARDLRKRAVTEARGAVASTEYFREVIAYYDSV